MKLLDTLHRWCGGIVGLVLAVLGFTGAILLHKEEWIMLPHAHDPLVRDHAAIAAATERMLAAAPDAQSIVYASERLGLHQIRTKVGGGAYADQAGEIVTRWSSQWERPELWLFDLHHHLFTGDTGEMVIGIVGLSAIGFVVTGAILWWRTRRTFKFRLWPKRMSRPMIVMQHRDLGIVMAPLLLLSVITGTMMIYRWFGEIVVAPLSGYGAVTQSLTPVKVTGGPLPTRPDFAGMIGAAYQRFPDAAIRILALPAKPDAPVTMRMRRAAEWLPNGRSTLWFDGATSKLLTARDALSLSSGAQAFNGAYPLHAGKVGGLLYRLLLTLSGLTLAMLGTLTVWTFWFKRPKPRKAPVRPAKA